MPVFPPLADVHGSTAVMTQTSISTQLASTYEACSKSYRNQRSIVI